MVSDILGKDNSPPPAPDYAGAAQAQGAANLQAGQQSAFLSNPNIRNPYGSQNVTFNAVGPNGEMQPTVTQTLDPTSQAVFNQQQAMRLGLANVGNQSVNQVQSAMGQPFNPTLPNAAYGVDPVSIANAGRIQTGLDLSNVAKMPVNAGTTAYDAMLSRLQPQLDRNSAALESKLRNQGITLGSDAWQAAQRDQAMANNDLYSALTAQGVGLDMQANQQGYNQALQSGQFANSAQQQQYGQNQNDAQFQLQQELANANLANQGRQQAFQEQSYLRNLPLNEATALMSGSQIVNPQFQQYSGVNVGAAPVSNAAAQAGQYAGNLYSNQVAQNNAAMQGLFGLGSAGMLAFA